MSMYYGWDGKPINLEQWSALMGQPDRHVALTELGPLGQVSTVWLGLDHSLGSGPPMIFETMVFGGPMDQECVRYSTAEDALTGHNFLVTWLTSVLDPDNPKSMPPFQEGGKP